MENLLGKRLWTYRKSECEMNETEETATFRETSVTPQNLVKHTGECKVGKSGAHSHTVTEMGSELYLGHCACPKLERSVAYFVIILKLMNTAP
jgi:hypothetical protein